MNQSCRNKHRSGLKVRPGPSGLLFSDRVAGLNVLVDEFIPPESTWSRAPRQVSVALTNVCDLSCPHCYAAKGRDTLDFNHLTKWLNELDVNGCVGVGLGGG